MKTWQQYLAEATISDGQIVDLLDDATLDWHDRNPGRTWPDNGFESVELAMDRRLKEGKAIWNALVEVLGSVANELDARYGQADRRRVLKVWNDQWGGPNDSKLDRMLLKAI